MKKAPKMTKADELYLKKFMQARENMEVARVEDTLAEELKRREEARREYADAFEDKSNVKV